MTAVLHLSLDLQLTCLPSAVTQAVQAARASLPCRSSAVTLPFLSRMDQSYPPYPQQHGQQQPSHYPPSNGQNGQGGPPISPHTAYPPYHHGPYGPPGPGYVYNGPPSYSPGGVLIYPSGRAAPEAHMNGPEKRKRKSTGGSVGRHREGEFTSDEDGGSGSDMRNQSHRQVLDSKKRTKTQRACDSCRSRKIR